MDIYGYGEDALTLWAFKNRLAEILAQLNDSSLPEECVLFFRPSFGRRGGDESPQFGEFDFLFQAPSSLYLGEAKWDRSPEASGEGAIALRPEQLLRHRVFRQYVKEWTCGMYAAWDNFLASAVPSWPSEKPIAPTGSLLADNLQEILRFIQSRYKGTPEMKDVVLYLYDGGMGSAAPSSGPPGFQLVSISYGSFKRGNYIRL